MHHFLAFYFFATFLLVRDVEACMHYAATFPYSTSLPFEATLTDNGVVTCWISMTYDQHNNQQIAFSNHRHRKRDKREMQVAPTGQSHSSSPSRTERQKSNEIKGKGASIGEMDGAYGSANKTEQDLGTEEEENGVGVWLSWEFRCLDGFQAHAGIGLRAVWYKAHGQEFEFVPQVEEDFLGERWVYKIDLWCV